jgi:hypothetical protein
MRIVPLPVTKVKIAQGADWPKWLVVCAAALAVCLTGCTGQTILRLFPSPSPDSTQATQAAAKPKPASHLKKSEPKPGPTSEELFEYIRAKLLALSPTDGVNDNLEVAFYPDSAILSITQPDGRCDINLNAIDTNTAIWEVIDPSETNRSRADVLRLTLNSTSGKAARNCYDNQNRPDESIASNRARLFFSRSKANATPGFTDKMDKAIKKLIVESGGTPEKQIL